MVTERMKIVNPEPDKAEGCAVSSVTVSWGDGMFLSAKPDTLRYFAGRLFASDDSVLAGIGGEILCGLNGHDVTPREAYEILKERYEKPQAAFGFSNDGKMMQFYDEDDEG